MIILDSNYLLAMRDSLDSNNKKAIALSKRLEEQAILYLEDVLKEVQTVISVRNSHLDGFEWIDSIYVGEAELDMQYSLNPTDYFNILNYWRDIKNNKLSFVDAEILYLAHKFSFPVVSFDKELLSHLPKSLIF
jgi:predicted nucleic acid-binding protein